MSKESVERGLSVGGLAPKRICLLIRERLFKRVRTALLGASLRVFVLSEEQSRNIPILGEDDWCFGVDLAETFSTTGAREVLV